MMSLPPHPAPPPKESVLVKAHAGVRYAWGFLPARALLVLLSVVHVLGMPYQFLMPVVATDIVHGDAHTRGMLPPASGVGAIIRALWLAFRDSGRG
jgi:hypothetical protein